MSALYGFDLGSDGIDWIVPAWVTIQTVVSPEGGLMVDSTVQQNSSLDPSRVLIVIPSRFGSSRFPGKALADLAGQPLIVRVVENSRRITAAGTIVVATDDERIAEAVTRAGGQAE